MYRSGPLPFGDDIKLRGYSQLFYFDEDYGSSVSGSGIELSFGVIAIKEMDDFNIYGGLELIPFDDAELKGSTTFDMEREDIFGLRLGANYKLDDYLLRAEVALVSKQGFTLSMSRPF